jgi:euchromatic histone-lysine N-methyltransferase
MSDLQEKEAFEENEEYEYSEQEQDDFAFLVPDQVPEWSRCELLKAFTRYVDVLPQQVKDYLTIALADPRFIAMRRQSGRPATVPRTPLLALLYRCLRLAGDKSLPSAVMAVSLVTGLPPHIILDHNRIPYPQPQVVVMDARHASIMKTYVEIAATVHERMAAISVHESLPESFIAELPGSAFRHFDLSNVTVRRELVIAPADLPEDMSPQAKWCLLPPAVRKTLRCPYFCSRDLSAGFNPAHGLPPVPCFNDVDDACPPSMVWIAENVIPPDVPETYTGCACSHEGCQSCHLRMVQNKPTMTYTPDGTMDFSQVNDRHVPLIIECNKSCACDPTQCRNRVVQNGWKVRLMVTRSVCKSGWAVRTMEFIPKGSYVCEYLGEIVSDPDVAESLGALYDAVGESYLFDLDAYGVSADEMGTIDPSRGGNVAKFINHSCEPNLFQVAIGTVDSPRFHRITFFAVRNIYANEELSFDYCYDLDADPARIIACHCGSLACRTRLR